MKKTMAILLVLVVLALALTACSTKDAPYENNAKTEDVNDSSLNELVAQDVAIDDVGEEEFIELGDMI